MLTHEILTAKFFYDPDVGEFIFKPDPKVNRVRDFGKVAGYKKESGGKCIQYKGKCYSVSRLAWFYMYEEWPRGHLAHVDGDAGNTRLDNLRIR